MSETTKEPAPETSPVWYVEIVSFEGEVATRMGPFASERSAERCESGAMRNLNHERYYTRVLEEKVAK